jgi:hypothetical protein
VVVLGYIGQVFPTSPYEVLYLEIVYRLRKIVYHRLLLDPELSVLTDFEVLFDFRIVPLLEVFLSGIISN